MTKSNNWFESAFGEAPPEFDAAMRRAIAQDSIKDKRHVGVRGALLVAVLAIVLCGAALAAANKFGLIGMLNMRDAVVEESAEALMSTTGEQLGGELPDVAFSLGEVMSDGLQLLFTVRAEAKDPERVMLVDADLGNNPSTHESVDHWRGNELNSTEWSPVTFEQAAESAGKELVCAYMNGVKINGEPLYEGFNQVSVAYDEGAIIYAYSINYQAKQGEVLALELRINQSDGDQTSASCLTGQLTSSVVPTSSDLTSYSWDEPRAVPELNLTITRVYADVTPTAYNLYVAYKPLDGLDEFDLGDVHSVWFRPINNKGKAIKQLGDNTKQDKQDGSYLMYIELKPVADLQQVRLKNGKTIVEFDVSTATVTKGAPNPPEFELDDFSSPTITPEGAPFDAQHPSADIKLGSGASIPLLHEFDTAYSGISDKLEQLTASVGLSATYEGTTLTIDQIAASSGCIWLSYTIKSDEPFNLDYGRGVDDEYARQLAAPYFDAIVDGNMDEDANLTTGSGQTGEVFFPDERTMRGWARLENLYGQQIIPDKLELYLWTGYFAQRRYQSAEYNGLQSDISATPFAFKLNIDRTQVSAYSRSIDLNTEIKWFDAQLKRDRELSLVHLSMSPLSNTLFVDEVLSGASTARFNILDDSGKPLTLSKINEPRFSGSKKKPIKARYSVSFIGGLDSKSLTLVPIMPGSDEPIKTYVQIGETMPVAIPGSDALSVSIDSISIDTNNASTTYSCSYPLMASLCMMQSDNSDAHLDIPLETVLNPRLDYSSGKYTQFWTWRKQRGANPGERATLDSIGRAKYIEVSQYNLSHDMDQAVKISLEK